MHSSDTAWVLQWWGDPCSKYSTGYWLRLYTVRLRFKCGTVERSYLEHSILSSQVALLFFFLFLKEGIFGGNSPTVMHLGEQSEHFLQWANLNHWCHWVHMTPADSSDEEFWIIWMVAWGFVCIVIVCLCLPGSKFLVHMRSEKLICTRQLNLFR